MLSWDDDAPEFLNPNERRRAAWEAEKEQQRALCGELGLTRTEERLFLLLSNAVFFARDLGGDGWVTSDQALWKIYGLSVSDRARPKNRRRHYARLRQLRKRLNDKLRAAGISARVAFRRALFPQIGLVRAGAQAAPRPSGPKAMSLEECKRRLRALLARRRLPEPEVRELLAKAGCRPGTLKRARKQLGVTATRQGYGDRGGWLLSLPR